MTPLGPLRAVGRAVGFAAWTTGVVNTHRFAARFDSELRTHAATRQFARFWSRGVFPIMGVELNVEGEAPRERGPYLIVANHRSPLDILVCMNLVGGIVLSHHGVSAIPVVGDAARHTDTIFVDRADEHSGFRAIRAMRRALKERKNVIAFPEGTTFRGDDVRPFKRGAFAAARGVHGARVLPIGVSYQPGAEFVGESFGKHLLRMSSRPTTPIWATIGKPRPVPHGEKQAAALRDHVQDLVDRAARARDA